MIKFKSLCYKIASLNSAINRRLWPTAGDVNSRYLQKQQRAKGKHENSEKQQTIYSITRKKSSGALDSYSKTQKVRNQWEWGMGVHTMGLAVFFKQGRMEWEREEKSVQSVKRRVCQAENS